MRAYKANMIPGGVTPTINVSQYDNDYAVTVTLIEDAEIYTPPAGATIRVEGTKPDGHGFEYPCTYQGNVVTMPIYTQMTVVSGRFPIELVVYQSGLRVGSCNIVFAVEKAPLGEDTDISETVIPDIIAGAQAQAEAAAASATQAASSAASAETAKDAAMDAAQAAAQSAASLTVDTELSSTSTNPVQNKVIDATVTELKNDLTNNVVLKEGTGQVTEQNTTFFELSPNIFNYKTAESGKRLLGDGTGTLDASGYMTSAYIDVSAVDSITGYRNNGMTLSTPLLEYVLYDGLFNNIGRRTAMSGAIDVSGATFIRFNGTDSIKQQYMIVDSSKTVTSYIPYETTFKYASDKEIHLTPSDDIIQNLIDNAGSTFVFDNGNYDIIAIYESKYGSDYFTNYAGYSTNNVADRGFPVLRGTKIKCTQGAVFTCNYTGSNTNVRDSFSAFAIESAVEINGLRLTASGIRNCIHDDFDNFYSGTTPTIIKNCILEHDRMVMAGGLAQHDFVLIENCIFTDTFVNNVSDFYYHNNSNSDAQSFMVIKDCYLNKGVGIKYYGSSTKMTDVIITNNSMANAIDFGANSGATVENMRIKEWNNVIRN